MFLSPVLGAGLPGQGVTVAQIFSEDAAAAG
jgi:hypothetical protein